jgi:hypothetical protein
VATDTAAENNLLFSAAKPWPPKIKLLKRPTESFFSLFLPFSLSHATDRRPQHPRRRSLGRPAPTPLAARSTRAAAPRPPPRRLAPQRRPPAPAQRRPPVPPRVATVVRRRSKLPSTSRGQALLVQPLRRRRQALPHRKVFFAFFIPYFWRPLFNCHRN